MAPHRGAHEADRDVMQCPVEVGRTSSWEPGRGHGVHGPGLEPETAGVAGLQHPSSSLCCPLLPVERALLPQILLKVCLLQDGLWSLSL